MDSRFFELFCQSLEDPSVGDYSTGYASLDTFIADGNEPRDTGVESVDLYDLALIADYLYFCYHEYNKRNVSLYELELLVGKKTGRALRFGVRMLTVARIWRGSIDYNKGRYILRLDEVNGAIW